MPFPKAAVTFRCAPSQVEPRERVAMAPSLISQAAAQVAIQALIRSDRAPGGGVRAAGARQVSPPAPAVPSPPSLLPSASDLVFAPPDPPLGPSRPLTRTSDYVQVPLLRSPQPRPGRRMFSASASQGAQGAARAALGGYSQAYGTVCCSALGRLPLLPGPHA